MALKLTLIDPTLVLVHSLWMQLGFRRSTGDKEKALESDLVGFQPTKLQATNPSMAGLHKSLRLRSSHLKQKALILFLLPVWVDEVCLLQVIGNLLDCD